MNRLSALLAAFLAFCLSLPALGQSPDIGYFVRPGLMALTSPTASQTVCLDSTTNLLDIFTAGGWLQATPPPSNFVAITAPGTGNDSTQGYQVGSLWENVSTGDFYACTSPAIGAAVWAQTNSGVIGGQLKPKLTTADWFSDWLVSGCIGSVPFSGFAMTTPTGVVIVSGLRVVPAADTFTYAASSDTYCFIQSDGTTHHDAVANGNPPPTDTGFNTQKVVTNGSQIISLSQIGPSLPTVHVPTASGSMPLPKTQADSLYVNNSAFTTNGDLLVGTGTPGSPAILHEGSSGTMLGVSAAGPGLIYYTLLQGGLITITQSGTNLTITDGLPAAGTVGNILQDNGSAWVSGPITNGMLPTAISVVSLSANHFIGTGAAPTVVVSTGAGALATASVAGTDTDGVITITTNVADTPAASAVIATITFATTWAAAPNLIVMPANDAAYNLTPNTVRCNSANTTTAQFQLTSGATPLPPTTAATYLFVYHALQ